MIVAASLIVLFTLLVLVINICRWIRLENASNNEKSTTPLETHPLATAWLQKANLTISCSVFLPTLVCVYLLGAVETLVTLIWKRGLLGAHCHKHTEQVIDRLVMQQTDVSLGKRRIAIITGGDSGIGIEIAHGLLLAGFHVVIASRTSKLGAEAKRHLNQVTGSEHVSFYTLDLCSFDSVREFVENMKSLYDLGEIDVLINNAGVMNIPCTFTSDGYEVQCQTNYISPLLLTLSLLPLMNRRSGQVLFAASSTLYAITQLDPLMATKTYGWNGLDHYAHSKMCVAQLTRSLGQKLARQSSHIKVNCYHPGTVRTNLFAHTTIFTLRIVRRFFDFIMLTPKEGSGTALSMVMRFLDDNTLDHDNGRYWADGIPQQIPNNVTFQQHPPSSRYIGQPTATVTNDMEHLWLTSLEQCGLSPRLVDEWIKSTGKPLE